MAGSEAAYLPPVTAAHFRSQFPHLISASNVGHVLNVVKSRRSQKFFCPPEATKSHENPVKFFILFSYQTKKAYAEIA
jgi:hypothetical protein